MKSFHPIKGDDTFMSDKPSDSEKEAHKDPEQTDSVSDADEVIIGPESIVINNKGERVDSSTKIKIEPYRFRGSGYLTQIEQHQLQLQHEQFIRALEARLSSFLSMDFRLNISDLNTASYSDFIKAVPDSSYITIFQVEQLAGNSIGVLNLSTRLAMTIIERLLGGKAQSVEEERGLTEIEMSLMEDVVDSILEEWCRQWGDTEEMSASVIGHENNGKQLQTTQNETIILVLTIEATFGDCCEPIQIGVPYQSIEPAIKKMLIRGKHNEEAAKKERDCRWRKSYDNVTVPVCAEWNAFEISFGNLLSLRSGDVIELSKDLLSQTLVRLENTVRYIGKVGQENNKVVVKLTEIVGVRE
jgi:flagellar motor switch protein FliM